MITAVVIRVGYKGAIKHEYIVPSAELAAKWKPLDELIKNTKGRVMNDDGTVILNILAGKELYEEGNGKMEPEKFLTEKYNYSFIDINKEIALKKYSLIINPNYKIEATVKEFYRLYNTYPVVEHFGILKRNIRVYIPKDGSS